MITYSFIIPHYNCPKLLDRCINSIPSRNDIQIIVVDDNSDKGKKPSFCGRSEVEYIYLNKEESKGAGRARNIGMTIAKGKWLLFADCDDYYCEGFLDVLDKYKDDTFDVLYFNFYHLDADSKELKSLYFKKYFDDFDGSEPNVEQIKFHHNVPWTKMINNNFLKKFNIVFEESINGNDILFSMTTGYFSNKIIVEKTPLYTYIVNSNSITTRKANVPSTLCRFIHNIKLNSLYKFIGHSEWIRPFNVYFLNAIRGLSWNNRFIFLSILLLNLVRIYSNKNEWVNLLNSKSKCL